MGILLAFNGYLTIAGLVMSGIGGIVRLFSEEVGSPIQDTGLILTGVGAGRKGIKLQKGIA